MNRIQWKKIESKGFKKYLFIYGTRMGGAGAIFAVIFKSVGMALIHDKEIRIEMFLSDLYSIGPWVFITGYASAYLTWKGYVKKYKA